MSGISVAIDGPAGAGKSTVSKLLAQKTGFALLDTGAMYRAVTFAWLQNSVSHNLDDVAQILANHQLVVSVQNSKTHIVLDGEVLVDQLRSRTTTAHVSEIAALKSVRDWAVTIQRKVVENETGNDRGIILEGRDIGTTVLPNATFKFFLTASDETRAQRRGLEVGVDPDVILKELQDRDAKDSGRDVSPLRKADDAVLIDASHLTAEQVVQTMIEVMSS